MKLGGKIVAVVLLLVALVLVNFLVSFFPARADLTSEGIYTLSAGTKAMLAKIEEPVALQFYFSRSAESLPIMFKNYATRVEEMLRQYVSRSGGRITLKVIDPQPDTDAETEARRLGILPQTLRTGEQFYFGLVAVQADQEKAIESFSPQREPFLEYDISQLIYGIQQFDKPRLGLISGLPLAGNPYAAMAGQRPQPENLSYQEWQNTFEIVSVEATAEELPENLDVLAVIHPQNLTEKLVFAVDQFVLSGRPTFIAVDPSSYFFRARQQQQNMMFGGPQPGVSSDLPKLFSAWGITFDPNSVVCDRNLATQLQNPSGGLMSYPHWLSFRKESFSQEVLPTSDLNTMLMAEAGSLEVAADRGYSVTPLVETTAGAGTVASMVLQFTQPAEIMRSVQPGTDPLTLAVLIQGSFKTAFPGGAPKTDTADEAAKDGDTGNPSAVATGESGETAAATPTETAAEPDTALKESARPGTLIIIADTDCLVDDFSVRRFNFLGMQAVEPLNDNLAFAANAMDFLGGSKDLISIRSKGTSQRIFTVFRDMEVAAQEKYQAQLDELEKSLNNVQEELRKLQSTQTEGRMLVATPEVEAALAKYREQEAEMRSERRKINLALRQGVKSLQNRLTFLNVLTLPALIIVVGIVFTVIRQNRPKGA